MQSAVEHKCIDCLYYSNLGLTRLIRAMQVHRQVTLCGQCPGILAANKHTSVYNFTMEQRTRAPTHGTSKPFPWNEGTCGDCHQTAT